MTVMSCRKNQNYIQKMADAMGVTANGLLQPAEGTGSF
jgi:hypothetical protein